MPKTRDLKPMAVWQEIEPTADDWDTIGKDEIFRMLVHLHLVRVFEEALLDAMGDDLINGPVHSSIGEEGSAIGAMAVLRDSDQMSGSHRGHSQFLGKVLRFVDKPGWNPLREPAPAAIRDVLQKTFAEIMGLAQGYCKGRAVGRCICAGRKRAAWARTPSSAAAYPSRPAKLGPRNAKAKVMPYSVSTAMARCISARFRRR